MKQLVLGDIQRVMSFINNREQEFIAAATEYGGQAAIKAAVQQRKELAKAEARMNELDVVFRKLYEDNALGRISEEQFVFLTSGYEEERKSLSERIVELKKEINTVAERGADVKRFLDIIHRYTEINELTYENVHELIDRILIHELDKENSTRTIEIF